MVIDKIDQSLFLQFVGLQGEAQELLLPWSPLIESQSDEVYGLLKIWVFILTGIRNTEDNVFVVGQLHGYSGHNRDHIKLALLSRIDEDNQPVERTLQYFRHVGGSSQEFKHGVTFKLDGSLLTSEMLCDLTISAIVDKIFQISQRKFYLIPDIFTAFE